MGKRFPRLDNFEPSHHPLLLSGNILKIEWNFSFFVSRRFPHHQLQIVRRRRREGSSSWELNSWPSNRKNIVDQQKFNHSCLERREWANFKKRRSELMEFSTTPARYCSHTAKEREKRKELVPRKKEKKCDSIFRFSPPSFQLFSNERQNLLSSDFCKNLFKKFRSMASSLLHHERKRLAMSRTRERASRGIMQINLLYPLLYLACIFNLKFIAFSFCESSMVVLRRLEKRWAELSQNRERMRVAESEIGGKIKSTPVDPFG